MRIIYSFIVLLIFLLLSCNSKKIPNTSGEVIVEEVGQVSSIDSVKAEKRKLRFLRNEFSGDNRIVIAYYDDGTISEHLGDTISLEELNSMRYSISKTYTFDQENGKFNIYALDGSKLNDVFLYSLNSWDMVDYQWHDTPRGLEKAELNIFEEYFGITEVGVEVLLYQTIMDDDAEVSPEKDWYQLSFIEDSNQFVVDKVNLSRDEFYWECGEMTIPFVVSDSPHDGLILFRGVNTQEGDIETVRDKIEQVYPGEKYTFTFGGIEYTLKAEGFLHSTYMSDEAMPKLIKGEYSNYKLYLSSGDQEQLLMSVPSFEDNYIEIQFIGDLDGDHKPDFIFETATHYESHESTLYLSSFAEKGQLVKCVGKDGYALLC